MQTVHDGADLLRRHSVVELSCVMVALSRTRVGLLFFCPLDGATQPFGRINS